MKKYDWRSKFGQLLTSYASRYADIVRYEWWTQDIELTKEDKAKLRKMYEECEKAKKELLNYCGYEYEEEDFYIN